LQSGRHKASGWWGWLVNGTTLGKKTLHFIYRGKCRDLHLHFGTAKEGGKKG